jgi:hypothetical protein
MNAYQRPKVAYSNTVAASSGSPADLIADPLYADSENDHHYRSERNPKDR